MRRRWLRVGTVVVSLLLALAGIRFILIPAFIATPDTVHVVVMDVQLPSAKETVIFDHQLSHQASAVYEQLVAGVQYTETVFPHCPASSNSQPYYHYELTVFHLGMKVSTATSDARDCATIVVANPGGSTANYSWETNNHTSFWVRLHQLVNAPEPLNSCLC